MTPVDLYQLGLHWLFVWFLIIVIEIMKYRLGFLANLNLFAEFMVIWNFLYIILYTIQPCFRCGHRNVRMGLMIVLKNVVIAPFGKTNFLDCFYCDNLLTLGT
jgi:hypothetical protein